MLPKYQVEYKCNGISNIFEFYLFVNPLGQKCYNCERELLQSLDLISSKVDVHILPFHNQALVDDFLNQLDVPTHDLDTRNAMYDKVYLGSLAFKAASLQGKRLGRNFLAKMQSEYNGRIDEFDREAVLNLAEEVHLDMDMFNEDLTSDFTRELYLNDQRIAQEMNVVKTPSLVIFEHLSGEDGIIMHNSITTKNILRVIDELMISFYEKISELNSHKQESDSEKIIQFFK